jgi:hypothetical protein
MADRRWIDERQKFKLLRAALEYANWRMLRRPKGSQKQSRTASPLTLHKAPMVEPQTVAAFHVHHKAPAPVADAALASRSTSRRTQKPAARVLDTPSAGNHRRLASSRFQTLRQWKHAEPLKQDEQRRQDNAETNAADAPWHPSTSELERRV